VVLCAGVGPEDLTSQVEQQPRNDHFKLDSPENI
jgi:hypothetical protein